MARLGPRKDHRKAPNRRLKASAGGTASQLRRSPKPLQTCFFALQIFQNASSGYGQQKPLNCFAQFVQNDGQFEAPKLKIFGRALMLFIAKIEASNALSRLAHCLKRVYLPQIDLEGALSDRQSHLQASNHFGRIRGRIFLKSGHTGGRCRPCPLQRSIPDHPSCHPHGRISRNRRPETPGRIPIGQLFAKLHFGPQSLDFLILAHFTKPLNFPLFHSRPSSLKTSFFPLKIPKTPRLSLPLAISKNCT